jgi:IS30 family transposase
MQSYVHFTLSERGSLYQLWKEGKSLRQIALELGRNVSSISRELRRNRDSDNRYNAWNATFAYIRKRKRCKRRRRFEEASELKKYVIQRLQDYWPPETVVAIWKRNHPQERLSHNSIYRAIKEGDLPNITEVQHLRRQGKLKFKGHNTVVKAERRITQWPLDVVERTRIGDWEGDTVYGSPGKGLVVTLVDRYSRFLLAKLCPNKKAATVSTIITSLMHGRPVHTMSFDNGSEFAEFRQMETALKTIIYFADPHSPWQRGTNENTNGILRFFFPKGCNFHNVTDGQLDKIVDLINDRPKKCLGWLSPREVFLSCCT